MANEFEASVEASCVKVHVCVGCGCKFAYKLKRVTTSTAKNPYTAKRNARESMKKGIALAVDPHPCPTCGLLQPEMLGLLSALAHSTVFGCFAFALLGLLIAQPFFLSFFSNSLQIDVWTFFAIATTVVLAHFAVMIYPRNRNLDAQRLQALQSVSSGLLRVLEPGASDPPATVFKRVPWSGRLRRAVLFLAVGLGIAFSAEAVRLAMGWRQNTDCKPFVAGPGDEVTVKFPNEIRSVEGRWKGIPTVILAGVDDPHLPEIKISASSSNSQWKDIMVVKQSEDDSKSSLWVDVDLPDDDSLNGQTVMLKIKLDVSYPKRQGQGDHYEVKNETCERLQVMHLSTPKAGLLYLSLARGGLVVGTLMILFSSLSLSFTGVRTLNSSLLETIQLGPPLIPETKAMSAGSFLIDQSEPISPDEQDFFRTNHDEVEDPQPKVKDERDSDKR